MWIFLWIVISSILIGATLWSLQILLRQKAAWEVFAKARNFTFKRGTFMGPAEMSGVIGDYKLFFFTAERRSEDSRTRRFVTAIELSLVEGIIDGGAAGTKEMLPFMQSLDKIKPYTIKDPEWKADHFVFMKHDAVGNAYLTPERMETIVNLLNTRNADVLLLFTDKELFLRVETTDPMQDADKIEKIVKRLMGLCDKLRITPEQRKAYMDLAPTV